MSKRKEVTEREADRALMTKGKRETRARFVWLVEVLQGGTMCSCITVNTMQWYGKPQAHLNCCVVKDVARGNAHLRESFIVLLKKTKNDCPTSSTTSIT